MVDSRSKLLFTSVVVVLSAVLVASSFTGALGKAFLEVQPSNEQSQRQADITITIPEGSGVKAITSGVYYEPLVVNASVGDTIEWKNSDSAPHTSTARDGSFDTGIIPIGSSGYATVQNPGSIAYYCIIHPWMTAALQVGASGNGTSSPPPQQRQTQTAQQQMPQPQQDGGQQTITGAIQQSMQQQQNQTTAQQPLGQPSAQQPPQQPTTMNNPTQILQQLSPDELAQALQQLSQMYDQAANALQTTTGGVQPQPSGQQQGTQGQQAPMTNQPQQPQGQAPAGPQQQQQSMQQPSDQQQQAAPSGAARTATITITIPQGAAAQSVQQYYQPVTAQVQSGSQVTWQNQDSAPHTATADDGSFDTGIIQAGSSGSAIVQGQGAVNYYCTIHPWMTATLQVTGSIGGSISQQQMPQLQQQQQGQQTTGPNVGSTTTQQPTTTTQQAQTQGQTQGGSSQLSAQAGNHQQTTQTQQLQQGQQQQQSSDATQTSGEEGFTTQPEAPQQVQAANQTASQFLEQKTIPVNATLPSSNRTVTGTEPEHKDNWITANHDIFGTRSSNQSIIGKNNVDQLQAKWILNNPFPIESPPVIVGNKGYVLDNGANVIAFDANTGENLWKVKVGEGSLMHGMTYDNGILFVPTGHAASVAAVDATNGTILWESPVLGPKDLGFGIGTPPVVWKDYVIVGSAGGDFPPFPGVVQGNITALNRTNGEIIWSFRTTTGEWVSPEKIPPNGGGTSWSAFSFDPETGILYAPIGNATPDFNATSRAGMPNKWTNHVIALNVTNAELVWATPFIEHGTMLNVTLPDTHDWDVAFGTSVTEVAFDNGTQKKIVIGHDKMGNIIAMDAQTGNEIWWKTVGVTYRTSVPPKVNGSGEVWPGTQYGVEAFHAVDNNTLYVAVSNMGYNYYVIGLSGYLEPLFDAIDNGIGNGTIMAIDMRTGETLWEHPTPLPTWVSPLVTNEVVFSGHITDFGKPYTFNAFGAAIDTPKLKSGIIMALDQDTGEKLWEFNVGAPVGIGGPAVGNGMLYVTTGSPAEIPGHEEGSIVAFGLPDNQTVATNSAEDLVQSTAQADNMSDNTTNATPAAEQQRAGAKGQQQQ